MKIIILILAISFCAIITHAQITDKKDMSANTVDRDALLLKSKKQKTTGWILIGGGAGLTVAGFIIGQKEAIKDPLGFYSGEQTSGAALIVIGAASMVGSIPFFIASGKNKRKAELMLKNETFLNPHLNLKNHYAALGLKIHL